jgi:hypothetical protein
MTCRKMLGLWLCVLAVCCTPLWAVEPEPIPGGDVLPPLIHSFLPGPGTGFDGRNADPNGITNFQGTVAMGYTSGTATDSQGNTYNIGTDIRVFQGKFVGVEGSVGGVGASKSAKGSGTFVLI